MCSSLVHHGELWYLRFGSQHNLSMLVVTHSDWFRSWHSAATGHLILGWSSSSIGPMNRLCARQRHLLASVDGLVTNLKLRKKLVSITRPIRRPLRQPRPRIRRVEFAVRDVRWQGSGGGVC